MADNKQKRRNPFGIDSWLQSNGKTLQTGGELRIRLRKGPGLEVTADPVDPTAAAESFPAILKFPTSTVPPDFSNTPWNTGRLYQQDIPKPEEDEEDEDDVPAEKKRRWRYNRNLPVPRQWILQEEVDFLETMVDRREQQQQQNDTAKRASTRYEGTPEHNASHFLLLQLNASQQQQDQAITVRHMPSPESTILFQQPAVRTTLSLSQAEQAIHDQRNGIVRGGTNKDAAGIASILPRRRPAQQQNTTKSRLLQKLKQQSQADDVEDGDDVMADVKFEKRKGGATARRELLTSMATGMSVSDDGVLGGTNDAAFAGRQRFAKLNDSSNANNANAAAATTERGADGAAMADDFYTRDVSAEYEELDYDANEQFDDDDVDVGESEILNQGEVVGDDDEDDDEDDSVEDDEESVGGAAGLETAAGFKALLAKARGEAPAEPANEDAKNAAQPRNKKLQLKPQQSTDHKSKLLAATQKPESQQTEQETADTLTPSVVATAPTAAAPELRVDENGLRILSLESVRQEIWLNQGQMPMKRLMKVFKVKGNAERQDRFRSIVKELCTVVKDHVHGNMFVLKQHYRY